jgi:NDP-sugar pyrophosphorylase family protein
MTTVLIQAGGRGERLRSLTDHIPKPMVKLGKKPMVECVLDRLIAQGFKDFVMSVHYRADVITDYFDDGSKWGVSIDYIHEFEPMGTAGAVGAVVADKPFLVHNCDVIADIDYRALLAAHDSRDAVATMCVALYQHQVPYGVVKMFGPFVEGFDEKPVHSWPVNAGVYVFDPDVPKQVSGPCGMDELLGSLKGFVATYQIDGFWQDVGQIDDYWKAQSAA